MNRNYRVVFNQSTGTYVAVAENTTARKKSKTTVKTIVAALSVSAMLMGASSAAHASFVGDNSNTHYGNNHIVIGQGAQVGSSNKDNPAAAEAIAIGVNAKALGNNAIALGYNAEVGKGTIQSIAIGSSAKATGTQSTAIGNDTFATGHSSVAIGGDDVNEVIKAAGEEYTALTGVVLVDSQWQNTESKGHGSVAIGVQSLAEGNFSTALGMTAKTQGTGSVAFGANARGLGKGATGIGTASQAIGQQATAIGMNSAATAQNATAIGSGGNTPATATKATADGAIAIGGNLVKGSQATGKNAIAIGGESEASKDNAIAIGAGSKSTHGNSVALGVNSVATGANIGNAAWQPKDATGKPIAVVGNAIGEVSIGKTGSERRLTNVAAGSADTDGVNVSQLKALSSALTSNVNALTNNLAKVDGKVNNLQTSVNTLEQGWKLKSDGDVATAVKAGNTVAINSGSNIDVTHTGNTITVNTTQDMTLNSVSFSDTAGNNSVLSASGLNVSNADNSLITNVGAGIINVGGNTHTIAIDGATGEITGLSNTTYDPNNIQADRAATEGQIADLDQQLTNKGFSISAQGSADDTVKLGETVDFSNTDGNIEISNSTDNGIQFKLANAISVQSVTVADGNGITSELTAAGTEVSDALGNNATYGANGISIGNTTGGTVISIKDGDVNFGGNTLGGVGAGVNPDDAINKGQLDNLGDHLAGDIFGGNATYDGNTITWSNIGGTGESTVDGAIDSVNKKVNLGWNAADTAGNTFNVAAGQTVGFINSDGNIDITAAGSSLTFDLAKDIKVNSVTADDGLGNKTVLGTTGTSVSDAQGNNAHYGANSSSFTDTAGNSNISTALGNSLTDAAGNTYISTAAGSELTNANGDQTNLSAAGTYVQDALGNNAMYGANGISIGNTTGGTVISIKDGDVNFGGNTLGGVGAGVNPDDAINKGQLDNLGDHLAGDIFGGNATYDGNTITWSNIGGTGESTVDGAIDSVNKKVNLGWNAADTAGNTFNVAAGQTVGFINSDGNIDITAAGSSLTFDLAKDIKVNSVTADDGLGNKTVLGTTGTSVSDAAGNIAHYGANSSSFTDTAGNSNISTALGNSLTDAAGNTYISTAAGSELTNANGDQTNLSAAGTYVQDALGNNATYGANGISIADAAGNLSTNIGADFINVGGNTHTIAIDGNTGEITGLGNTAYDPSNVQADRAATEGQIQDALKQISQQGFGVSAQGGMSDTVALGETVDFASKDGNIAVSTGVDNQILFQLSDSLNVSNITMQDANGNVNYSDATGNRVQDALGNNAFYGAIGNVFTDKAGNSFNSSAAGSHISNSKGDVTNITVAGTQVSDAAGNNANYGAAGNTITNATGDSTHVSAGNITVGTGNGGSISIGGNGIDAGGNNITNVVDGKAAGDAVNKGQLDQAVNDINNSIGAVNNSGVQYDKNADGTVNKDSITLAGGANGTTITNVANGKVEAGSKDAVNGGQLHDALQQINNNQSTINNDILGITTGPDGKPKLDLDIYDVANQTKTSDLTLVDAINTVNQEGTKYAHTNAVDESEEPGLINPDNNSASAGGKNSSAFGVNAIVDDTATNGLAMGYQSQVGEGATNAVSIGSQTQANGESSLALGHGSQANGKQSISIGTGNVVNGNHSGAIGDPSTVNGDGSYSIGNNNTIDADNSFVLGNEVTISKDATDMSKTNGATFGGSVGLGNGSTVDAAIGTKNVTIGDTTYDFAGSAPVGTISVGGKDAERTITNVAAGRVDATSTDAINGSQLYATNQAVDSLIKGEAGPVQYVKDGDGKAQNVVNLKGAADSNAPVTLSNVADGKAPNDAVNVGQMQKMGDKINARIDGLEDESRAGVATALAVANLPQVYIPGKSGLAIATGVHKGEVGYALGYSSISEGGNWVFKASATANRMGDVGGGAGLLYMFD